MKRKMPWLKPDELWLYGICSNKHIFRILRITNGNSHICHICGKKPIKILQTKEEAELELE